MKKQIIITSLSIFTFYFQLLTFNCSAQTAYITNYGDNTVSVINVATNTVIDSITVGIEPSGVSVSPDGNKVYVANQVSKTVSVISTATNTITATIPVGLQPPV